MGSRHNNWLNWERWGLWWGSQDSEKSREQMRLDYISISLLDNISSKSVQQPRFTPGVRSHKKYFSWVSVKLCNSLTSPVQSFMGKGTLLRLSSTLSSHSLKVFSGGDSTINYLPIHKISLNFWKTKARVSFSWPVAFHLLLHLLHKHNCSPFFFLMLKYKAIPLNLAVKAIH